MYLCEGKTHLPSKREPGSSISLLVFKKRAFGVSVFLWRGPRTVSLLAESLPKVCISINELKKARR